METNARTIINLGTPPRAPYSHAVSAAGLIYLSGVLADDANRGIVGRGDVAAQTREVLERLGARLAAAGSSLRQVVSVTVYLTSASDFAAMNDVYREYWPTDPPTRTSVIAALVVPDALVEMSMIAVPDGAERTVIHPAGLAALAQPVQLRDPDRRHALSVRRRVSQRPRQRGRARRRAGADPHGARERRRDPEGRGHDLRERRQCARVPSGRGDVRRDER